MPKKKTLDQHISDVKERNLKFNDGTYIILELPKEDTGVFAKFKYLCTICNSSSVICINDAKVGCGCKQCKINAQTTSDEAYLHDILNNLKFKDYIICYPERKIKRKTTITYYCKLCNELKTITARSAKAGHGCEKCGKVGRICNTTL